MEQDDVEPTFVNIASLIRQLSEQRELNEQLHVDFVKAEATIAEQAATIERFREHRLASIAYDNRDVSCSADEHRALLARWSSAEAAITAADMGE